VAAKSITVDIKGGDLLERYLQSITKKLGHGVQVKVGILADAKYSGTHPIRGTKQFDGPVAQVAFWQEFGTDNGVPPRPFMRETVAKYSGQWGNKLGKTLRATKYDARKSLKIMGRGIQLEMRQTLNDWTEPPNAPRTVARKGFNKPLIDTGHLERSIDFQIIEED
jgi:hypothetical protein